MTIPGDGLLWLLLAVTVKQHAAVSACNIWRCKIFAGIFICNDRLFHIGHGVQRNLPGFAVKRFGEVFDLIEPLGHPAVEYRLPHSGLVKADRAALTDIDTDFRKGFGEVAG